MPPQRGGVGPQILSLGLLMVEDYFLSVGFQQILITFNYK